MGTSIRKAPICLALWLLCAQAFVPVHNPKGRQNSGRLGAATRRGSGPEAEQAGSICIELTEPRRRNEYVDALVREGFPTSSAVHVPGDAEYESKRNDHFNLDVICRPLLFVCPSTSEEVASAVRAYGNSLALWSEDEKNLSRGNDDVPGLCISGGRHSTRSMKEGAVILDLSRMQKVQVNPEEQTVTVEGGVKIGTMLDALSSHHLSPVTGTHTDTGVIGLSLGGGQGFLSKKYGPAIDQIVSAEVVLADGSIRSVHKDRPEDADIMFNLRGAGGNIGVVTKLTMRVYPMRNLAMAETVHLALTKRGTSEIISNYADWSVEAPDECVSFCALPFGVPIVAVMGVSCDTSVIRQDTDACYVNVRWDQVPGLKELKKNRLGSLFRIKASFHVRDFHTEAMKGTSTETPCFYYYTNMYIPRITPEFASIIAEAQRVMGRDQKGAMVLFNQAGTKATEVKPTDSAFETRNAKYWILTSTAWEVTGNKERDRAERQKVVDFNRWFRTALLNAGAQSTVHPVADMDKEFGKSEYGHFVQEENKEKIIRIQNSLDPNGVFRANRSVG